MEVTVSKIVALVIAIGYAVGIIVFGSGFRDYMLILALLVPLGLIWLPEICGEFTGYAGHFTYVDCETPPWLVSAAGWFLLVGLPAICWLLSRPA